MAKPRCPQCKKEIQWKGNPYRPFCTERCKLIDLGKWIEEAYRVGGEPVDLDQLRDELAHPENAKK